jgi:ribose transport system substrate-binding protein
MKKSLLLLLAAMMGIGGCSQSSTSGTGSGGTRASGKKPTVAYVTNGIASFWVIAEAGAKAAGKEFDVNVEVRMPPSDGAVANQKRMIEELLTMGVDGIAVSPIDPDNQTDILNAAAEQTKLITHDSDAPKSKRIAYIGVDNYAAGRICGELVKSAMPEGGSVMIFVGRIEQLNAKLRRQGLIDELLDRSHDSNRYDEPGQVLKGDKYTILDTRTDNFDFGAAKALPEDAIAKHPELGCMVGLFAYNPPYLLEALKGADKLGKIKVVAFDEQDETLQAIADGHCYGTVVQNPYMYGYESVRVLAGLARGDDSVLPKDGFLDIEARKITKDNVKEFWDELKRLTSGEKTPAASK